MIRAINHLTFSVRDLEVSFTFYKDILGFKPLAKWAKGAYLLCGDDWICLALDPKTRAEQLPEYTHTAFYVEPKHFRQVSQKVLSSGAPTWQENTSEGDSLYFIDPNGHKFEIHSSTWQDRIKSTKANPYKDMEFFI